MVYSISLWGNYACSNNLIKVGLAVRSKVTPVGAVAAPYI